MFYRGLMVFLLTSLSLSLAQPQQSAPAADGSADLVKQGQKLNDEGNQDGALALYTKALEESPGSHDAHLAAGIALDLKGNYEEARQHFTKAIALAPPDAKPQSVRAMAVSYVFEA